jgi:1,4-dihydroxy-2-naphthoate octaprenyltransferase
VTALALQVAVNYANDYFDGVRGIDTPDRTGPRRVVAAGLVEPRQMKIAIGVALAVAAGAGLALTLAVGPELLLVGAASIVAALAYSGGPRPYASAALGELFVFVFFGLVATVGSAYVQIERVPAVAVVAAVPVGMLASAILVVNNLRDIETDAAAGKRTLAVRLGRRRTWMLYSALLLGSLLWAAIPLALVADMAEAAVVLLGFLPGLALVHGVEDAKGPALVKALEHTAAFHLSFGLAIALLLW